MLQPPEHLFLNLDELADNFAYDVMSDQFVEVPREMHMFIAGF